MVLVKIKKIFLLELEQHHPGRADKEPSDLLVDRAAPPPRLSSAEEGNSLFLVQ